MRWRERTAPYESRHIPERYDFSHAVAFFFLDSLTGVVPALEEARALGLTLDLTARQREEIQDLHGEELWRWMGEGFESERRELTYRQVVAAVVADMSHFLYEALITCGKGKTTVSYSLLRKPLKENLLLLEWMVADPEDFLDRFEKGPIRSYTLNRLGEEKRREIIEGALEKLQHRVMDAELLYDLRYSKREDYSLEKSWHHATHLVTGFRGLETEVGNLNFVFSQRKEIESQWDGFYNLVLPLLLHALLVVEAAISPFAPLDEHKQLVKGLLRLAALARHQEVLQGTEDLETVDDVAESLSTLIENCPTCGEAPRLERSNIDRLWAEVELFCHACETTRGVWEEWFSDGRPSWA